MNEPPEMGYGPTQSDIDESVERAERKRRIEAEAEVERLRVELACRDQQITAVRKTLDGLSSRYTVGPENFPRVFGLWYTDLRAALDGTP